jgi:hypothetical protein
MLSGQVFDELTGGKDEANLARVYRTEKGAKKALVRAIRRFVAKQGKKYLS